jgi:hypothetical protein
MRKEMKTMRHDMTLIHDEFNDILDKLHSKLFDEFLANPTCDTYYAWSRVFEPSEFHGIEVHSGCTRAVIVAPDSNYVFKIQFDWRPEDDVVLDYGRNEEYVYGKAVEKGLEEFFAWTAFLGKYDSAAVYVMEKVEVNQDKTSEDSYLYHINRDREEGRDVDDEYYDVGDYSDHEGMFEFATSINGVVMNEVEDLLDYLCVGDCHAGNWGYRGTTLVLTDYAGYCQRVGSLYREENE